MDPAPPRPEDFFEKMPLYREFRLDENSAERIVENVPPQTISRSPSYPRPPAKAPRVAWVSAPEHYVGSIDLFCTQCNAISVFTPAYRDTVRMRKTDMRAALHGEAFPSDRRVLHRVFQCSRDAEHDEADFLFRVSRDVIVKFGQLPSVFDQEDHGLRRFRKHFPQDERELRRAIGLYSHSVGVGSFVYLRRIFERLLLQVALDLSSDGTLDLDIWKAQRSTADRVRLIREQNPGFLTEAGTDLYSILSKAIHELDEDYCLKWFPPLHLAIVRVLEDELARLDRRKRDEEIRLALQAAKNEAS